MPRHATQTSYTKGRVRPQSEIQKAQETLNKQKALGLWKSPLLGLKHSQETLKKRAITRRKNAVGNRSIRICPGSPNYWVVMTPEGRRYEHRVIMSKHLGRPLLRNEHIHHKDGDGLNNSLDNLQLVSPRLHSQIHQCLGQRWSKQFDQCLKCQTREKLHMAQGLCTTCYQQEHPPKKKRIRRK